VGFSRGRGFWRGLGVFGGAGEGCQHVFDLVRGKIRRVQQGEGDGAVGEGKHVGQAGAQGIDGFEKVGRQGMAIALQKTMAFGRGVERGTRGGEVGCSAGFLEVWGVMRDFADGGGYALEVTEQNFGEDRVQIDKMAF